MKAVGLSQKRRLALALCLVAALLLGAWVADGVIQRFRSQADGQTQGESAFGAGSLSSGAGTLSSAEDTQAAVFALFGIVANTVDCRWGDLPEGFEEEVFDPEDFDCDSLIGAEGTVGFVCSGTAEDVFARLDAVLAEAGWERASSETADSDAFSTASSYVKPEGEYRWLYLSCSEVSGSVCVWVSC